MRFTLQARSDGSGRVEVYQLPAMTLRLEQQVGQWAATLTDAGTGDLVAGAYGLTAFDALGGALDCALLRVPKVAGSGAE